jgi:hypothetical protein
MVLDDRIRQSTVHIRIHDGEELDVREIEKRVRKLTRDVFIVTDELIRVSTV